MSGNSERLRVVVTGGRTGIGRAIAEAFAKSGHRVLTCSPTPPVRDETPDDARIMHTAADVADPREVDKLFATVERSFEGLDVLINNAGVSGPTASIEDVSPEDWLRTLAVNLSGPFYCARHAARLMKEQKSGAIINIGTTSVRVALPFRAPYVASKSGLHGLTRSLARELGPYNIRCNTVSPGMVDNERSARIRHRRAQIEGISEQELLDYRLKFISMRRMVSNDDVAGLTVFLASQGGRYISGQEIPVCGNLEWE